MYAVCSLGHRHWGVSGAAGGLLVTPGSDGPQVLLTLRSAEVHHGNTWSIPGGAIDPGDVDAHAAAAREIHEELHIDVARLPVIGWHTFDCGGWTYSTVLLAAPEAIPVVAEGWETDDVRWFDLVQVDCLAAQGVLHHSFAKSWPELRDLVTESEEGLASTMQDQDSSARDNQLRSGLSRRRNAAGRVRWPAQKP